MPSQIEKRTQVAKRISQLLIQHDAVSYSENPTHMAHQKTVRDGKVKVGRTSTEKLLIYGSEDQAAFEDSVIVSEILTYNYEFQQLI